MWLPNGGLLAIPALESTVQERVRALRGMFGRRRMEAAGGLVDDPYRRADERPRQLDLADMGMLWAGMAIDLRPWVEAAGISVDLESEMS